MQHIEIHEAATNLGQAFPPWAILSIPLGVVALIGLASFSLAWRNGRLAQEERNRLLGMGIMPNVRTSRWPQALYCSIVGLGVPTGSFLLAWSFEPSDANEFTGRLVWVAAMIVSTVSLIGTSVVAAVTLRPDRAGPVGTPTVGIAKAPIDSSAFEFSGHHSHA